MTNQEYYKEELKKVLKRLDNLTTPGLSTGLMGYNAGINAARVIIQDQIYKLEEVQPRFPDTESYLNDDY